MEGPLAAAPFDDAAARLAPSGAMSWLALSAAPLPVASVWQWLVRPDCGGQVVFTGTVRDSAEGRSDVTGLDYEAYEEQAVARLGGVEDELRARWPDAGPVALLHRVGSLQLCDVAVVVGVGAPHRDTAFAAARFAIDAVKASVPIWKRERWAGGDAWGTGAHELVAPSAVGEPER